jgi:hypothetical protein
MRERIFCSTISGYFWFDNTMFGSCSHGMGVVRNILACIVGTYGCGSVCVESG